MSKPERIFWPNQLTKEYDSNRENILSLIKKTNNHQSSIQGEPTSRVRSPFEPDPKDTEIEAATIRSKIEKLTELEPIARDIERKNLMAEHKIKARTIDEVIKEAMLAKLETEAPNIISDFKAWPEEVDGATLLEEISLTLSRFVILPDSMDKVISLWVMLTYCYDDFRILPQLALYSPDKRCGKTTLLEVLCACANNALAASNITPAAIYHIIEEGPLTLAIDEADTFFKNNRELQGICNSGHTKNNAFVFRAGKGDQGSQKYSTWCPKVIALIGKLGGTQHDRSIIVNMRRRLPDEKVEKLPLDLMDTHADIRRKCIRWANDNSSNLRNACPEVPETGNDRQQDNWTPLFAIAECVGGEWPDKAKQALISIAAEPEDSEPISVELLRDIHKIFTETQASKITSEDLVRLLKSNKEAQWSTYGPGRGLTAHSLGKLLKPYKIKPYQLSINRKNKRGYSRLHFTDSFSRYIPNHKPLT